MSAQRKLILWTIFIASIIFIGVGYYIISYAPTKAVDYMYEVLPFSKYEDYLLQAQMTIPFYTSLKVQGEICATVGYIGLLISGLGFLIEKLKD